MRAPVERTRDLLLGRLARAQVDGRLPSVVAGVVRGGELVWSAGRGTVDDREPDTDVQYRIGSISKTLTALLVLRLRDEGRLRLSDPLDAHLPGTPFGDRTVGQMLSHTAGLQAETAGPWWERTPGGPFPELVGRLGPQALLHRAGRRFHYSNLGYAVLGELVGRLRGRPWGDCLREEVLVPLGMRRTTLLAQSPHAAGWAVHPFADVLLPEPAEDAGAMAPAGQVWSTVADLGRLVALLTGDAEGVLAADTLEEMTETVTVQEGPGGPTDGYGLGLQVWWPGGRRVVGHSGSMPGFLALVQADRDAGAGVVVLTNTTAGLDPAVSGDLLRTVLEEEPELPDPWRPAAATGPPDAAALELVGPWFWGPSALVMRLRSDGLLHVGPMDGRGRATRLRPRGDGTWVGLDGYYTGEVMRVVRRPDGRVSHLDLATFVLTREPYDPGADVPGGVDPAGWR